MDTRLARPLGALLATVLIAGCGAAANPAGGGGGDASGTALACPDGANGSVEGRGSDSGSAYVPCGQGGPAE
jgi:hypothetical protein